jgi:hypothetical protein
MEQKENSCCAPAKNKQGKGISSGILYSLLPHSFCIAFILFSTVGAVAATAFLKRFMLIPYFFHFLILASLLSATISAVIYLKKNDCLRPSGVKSKWKYIVTLYSTMIIINLLMFFVVFPALANINSGNMINQGSYAANLSIAVQIPCSGHAPLIIGELKKDAGIGQVIFKTPNIFEIKYNPKETSPEKIASLEIFKTYKAILQ